MDRARPSRWRVLCCLILAAGLPQAWGQGRAIVEPVPVSGAPVARAPLSPSLAPAPAALLSGALPPAPILSAAPTLSLPPPVAAGASAQGSRLAGLVERALAGSGAWALESPVAARQSPLARALRQEVRSQLQAMRGVVDDAVTLDAVALDAYAQIDVIEGHLLSKRVDPTLSLRYSETDAPVAKTARPIRIAVYPVAADPFQWAHILIGLQAIARLEVDKVVFVLAGDDPRKPSMMPVAVRHPMGRAVLDRFAPFFAYSSIAVGTLYDGETNIFRILNLNPGQPIEAFYIVGDDHYRLLDKKGNPDTLPKLEKNLAGMLLDSANHTVKVAFNEREGHSEAVPTSLDVTFLPPMSFEASSTLARSGKWALMPHAAYEHARKTGSGLYGIPR